MWYISLERYLLYSVIVFCRTIIQCVAQIGNLPPQHHGQRVSNIALINIERAYVNSVVNNDMDHIIDIFCRQNGKDGYFFERVL